MTIPTLFFLFFFIYLFLFIYSSNNDYVKSGIVIFFFLIWTESLLIFFVLTLDMIRRYQVLSL